MKCDKRITRWANMGYTRVLMFGRWWPLTPGKWRVNQRERRVFQVEHYDAPVRSGGDS